VCVLHGGVRPILSSALRGVCVCVCARVQGQTQGPCSIAQFERWLALMADNAALKVELEQFQAVTVWRVRVFGMLLSRSALWVVDSAGAVQQVAARSVLKRPCVCWLLQEGMPMRVTLTTLMRTRNM
jgi:hypothetical protein